MNRKKAIKHFVTPINLTIAIIINYQLNIERRSLEFAVMIFIFCYYSAPTLSLEI